MEPSIAGCFGKLPIYGDFIRFNADGRDVDRFDEWIQKGLAFAQQRLGETWAADFERADAWSFVFSPDEAEDYLAGVYTPSRDQGGRQYPFLIFCRMEAGPMNGLGHLLPQVLASFLIRSVEMARTGWVGVSLETFLLAIRQIRPSEESEWRSAEERYVRRLSTQQAREFWTDLFGEFEHPRKYLLYQRLVEVLQPIGRSSSAISLGLKFPLLSHKEEERWDLALWLDLIEQIGRHRYQVSSFFWNRPAGRAAPCALVLLGDPSPQNLALFVCPELEGETWYDLAPETFSGLVEAKRDLRSDRRTLLERSDLSLAAFIEAAR